MANNVCMVSKKNNRMPGLHNGDLIIIRSRHYLVSSVVYPENVKIPVSEKLKQCAIVSLHSGNKIFSMGIERRVDMSTFVSKVNDILANIRKNSRAHRNNYEYSAITEKDVRIIPRDEYDLIIEKL
jgi:hypothetical protein